MISAYYPLSPWLMGCSRVAHLEDDKVGIKLVDEMGETKIRDRDECKNSRCDERNEV